MLLLHPRAPTVEEMPTGSVDEQPATSSVDERPAKVPRDWDDGVERVSLRWPDALTPTLMKPLLKVVRQVRGTRLYPRPPLGAPLGLKGPVAFFSKQIESM